MTIRHLAILVCNSCGASFKDEPSTERGSTLRDQAARAGWYNSTATDLCPACKAGPRSPQTTAATESQLSPPRSNPEPQGEFGQAYQELLEASGTDLAAIAAKSLRSSDRARVKAARAILQARENGSQ